MIKINLNPKKEKRKIPSIKPSIALPAISLKNEVVLLIVIPIFIVSLTIVYLIYLLSNINSLESRKEALSQELQKYKDAQAKIDILKKKIVENEELGEKLNLKIKTYEYLSKSASLTGQMLVASINTVPDGVWLENVIIGVDKSSISGYAFQPDYISRYYENLNRYYNVNFNATESKLSPNNLRYYSFNFELKSKQTKPQQGSM